MKDIRSDLEKANDKIKDLEKLVERLKEEKLDLINQLTLQISTIETLTFENNKMKSVFSAIFLFLFKFKH